MINPTLFLDFETKAIGLRPLYYPPMPVGFAFIAGKEKGYVSWGHPDQRKAAHALREAGLNILSTLISEAHCIVAHNHGFDREVNDNWASRTHKPWHDTMFLAFLADPYGSMSLKPLAVKHLGMPPEERDAVRQWLEKNGIVRPNQKEWGAHICEAPSNIVGPYAIGDVVRTKKLYEHWSSLTNHAAYKRELALTPVITDMEKHGVRLNVDLLGKDINRYFNILDQEDIKLRKKLGDIDLDKDQAVASALDKRKLLKSPLPLTEKGQISVNKQALIDCVRDKNLLGTMLMRNALATSLRTFMQPWFESQVTGRLFFRFNQIRNERGLGARTGRMSSSPNMMNMPSKWEMLYGTLKDIGFKPSYSLPNVRTYLLADVGDVIISVDYNQQEMRLFAHYEDGALMHAYKADPTIDAHQMVADIGNITRKVAKTLNFAELYGAGVAVIMQWLECTEQEARSFKAQYRVALPGVRDLKDSIEETIKGGNPITTIGGRDYYPEAPKIVKGRLRDFNYKLLNYLIQGSAADQTKQAMIDYYASSSRTGRLMFTVHDEIVISAPKRFAKQEAELLSSFMKSSFKEALDVPFLTDTKIGENYGNI